jgi:hypothetical protein
MAGMTTLGPEQRDHLRRVGYADADKCIMVAFVRRPASG